MDKKSFNDALASLVEFAAANANHVSKEEIHTFFQNIITDEAQYEFIYTYLQESKIKIDGMEQLIYESVTEDDDREAGANNRVPGSDSGTNAVESGSFTDTNSATQHDSHRTEKSLAETEEELAFIEMYKTDLAAITPATQEEIRSLLHSLQNNDTTVVNRLLETQLAFVADIANEFRGQGVTYGDLIQEANVGLMLALSEFQGEEKDFQPFIRETVEQTLLSVVNEQINAARVGNHLANRMNELDTVSRELTELFGRAPSFQELSDKMGIPVDEIETIIKTSLNVLNAGDSQDEQAIDEASAKLNEQNAFINNSDDEFESGETDFGDPLEWKITKK